MIRLYQLHMVLAIVCMILAIVAGSEGQSDQRHTLLLQAVIQIQFYALGRPKVALESDKAQKAGAERAR